MLERSQNRNVLLLDDDPDMLNFLEMDLKKAGYRVYRARTGEVAIELLKSENFLVGIFDIVMGPSSTSEGVVRFVKDSPERHIRSMPIIVASSYLNPELAKKMEDKSPNIYKAVKKPFKPGQMSGLVNQLADDLANFRYTVLPLNEEENVDMEDDKPELDLSKLDTGLVFKDEAEAQKEVNELMLHSTDINYRNKSGETALMLFAKRGDLEHVRGLVDKKAEIDLKAPSGRTCVHYAVVGGKLEVLKYLCEKKAKINIKDNEGYEPLGLAIKLGHYLMVDYLINQGARIDVMIDGANYLFIAIDNGDLAIFNRLLASNLDPKSKNKAGKDIKTYAKEKGRKDFLRILNTLKL